MDYSRTSPFALGPWTRRIIAANAVVYLLTITLLSNSGTLSSLAFTPALALRQPWSAVTYMFLHGGVLHLAFNMLVLFFFGSAVEGRMGERRYPVFYLICGVGGAAFSFAFAYNSPIIGASAAVYGIALAFAYYWPDAEILIFPIPIPVKAKWLVTFLAVSSLVFALRPSADGIAHFAHLGGFAAGAAYLWMQRGRAPAAAARRKQSVLVYPKPESRATQRPNRWRDEDLSREVDRVLDKISATGIESLTPEEKKVLDESSRHMRRH